MGLLRKIGLWMLVVAGPLQAFIVGSMILVPYHALKPYFLLVEVGLWGGPVLALVGGLLAVFGWVLGPSAGGVKPGFGGSRVAATLAGICIGSGLGGALGWAPIMLLLWALHNPHLDQGALLPFLTAPAGFVVGAIAGGVLGASAGRTPSAV